MLRAKNGHICIMEARGSEIEWQRIITMKEIVVEILVPHTGNVHTYVYKYIYIYMYIIKYIYIYTMLFQCLSINMCLMYTIKWMYHIDTQLLGAIGKQRRIIEHGSCDTYIT